MRAAQAPAVSVIGGRDWPVLHWVLWGAQILLAIAFSAVGAIKLLGSMHWLREIQPWVVDQPEGLIRFIGGCETAGALALLVPAAARRWTALTPWAATGIATIMLLAMGFHIGRGEYTALPINFGLASVAVFVAWGRFREVPLPNVVK